MHILSRLVLFGLYVLYLKESSVNGAITYLKQLRRENSDIDEEQTGEQPLRDKEESGFDLDEEEIKKFHIWPNGVIPYYIDDLSFDKVLRDTIRVVLQDTSHTTGLQFLELPSPPKDDSRWVFFINRKGLLKCADHDYYSFTNQGVQKVVLGYDCIEDNRIIEVLLMLVGVPPQHNSPNRDDFIQVNINNIMPNKKSLLTKLNDDEWLFHDLEYDFNSVGHYDTHKFTLNGGATLIPVDEGISSLNIGFNKHLSTIDIKKIKMLYNFISKKMTSVQLPECSKMFNPGPNLTNYRANKLNEAKPRKKPNKYLGLPDSAPDVNDEENKSKVKENISIDTNITTANSDEDHNDDEEEIEGPNNMDNEEVANDVNKTTERNVTVEDATNESGAKTEEQSAASENEDIRKGVTDVGDEEDKNTLKGKKNKHGQNLLDLSDFATGEDR